MPRPPTSSSAPARVGIGIHVAMQHGTRLGRPTGSPAHPRSRCFPAVLTAALRCNKRSRSCALHPCRKPRQERRDACRRDAEGAQKSRDARNQVLSSFDYPPACAPAAFHPNLTGTAVRRRSRLRPEPARMPEPARRAGRANRECENSTFVNIGGRHVQADSRRMHRPRRGARIAVLRPGRRSEVTRISDGPMQRG